MADQIIINLTDSIPPANVATIDKDGLTGTTDTKTQVNKKISDLRSELQQVIESDFKGNLLPTDPAPTEDGTYKPALSSDDANSTNPEDYGTLYPNAGNLRAKKNYYTTFYKKGSIWTKSEEQFPQAEKFIPRFENLTFPASSGTQAVYAETVWQVKDGEIATETDIPSDDSTSVWQSIVKQNVTNVNFDPDQIVPTEALYEDGSVAVDIQKRISDYGVDQNRRETTIWYDGTAMTDARLDNDIFIKRSGKYLQKTISRDTFLKVGTISELRQTNAYYEGQEISLLGYYQSGDKATLTYKFTVANFSTLVDDGGSVIKASKGSWIAQFSDSISVKDFGAKGDGVTNDTDAIQRASDFASSVSVGKSILLFPVSNNFVTTDTITVGVGIDVIMDSPINYKGNKDRTALIIGNKNSNNFSRNFKINVTAFGNISDWTDESYKGVELINVYQSTINIVSITYFTINLELIGDTRGLAYNEIEINELAHGKIQLLLNSRDAGWCNDNNSYGGRFWVASSVNPGKSRYGIVIKSEDGYKQNNNVFYKTSLELNDEAAKIGNPDGEAVPIIIENGRQNKFENIRDEGNAYTIKTLNDSFSNTVDTGFSSVFARYNNRVKDEGSNPSTIYKTRTQSVHQELGWLIFNSGNLASSFQQFTSNTVTPINPDIIVQNAGSTGPTASVSNITINADNVALGNNTIGLGVRIDTSVRKRFNVVTNAVDNTVGRVSIICRDSGGNIINTDGLVKSSSRYTIVTTSNFGGGFAINTGTNPNKDVGNIMQYFTVGEEVKSISILFTFYDAAFSLRSFQVYSLDGYTNTIPYRNIHNKIASEVPVSTSFNGDFVFDPTTTRLGWKRTPSGWIEHGALATNSSAGYVKQSSAISDSTEANATDLATAITLVNDLKAKLNAKLAADRTSGQQAP
ncbi:hypothetical protein [Chryseobacterium taichungense]|uniref:hypothetical protein n=1 Tax=Chryseobacterium taichungense TaxID=295069 RepID=UPI0028A79BC2|nr:hypothetical protein [Chryseobacterium taichungense]